MPAMRQPWGRMRQRLPGSACTCRLCCGRWARLRPRLRPPPQAAGPPALPCPMGMQGPGRQRFTREPPAWVSCLLLAVKQLSDLCRQWLFCMRLWRDAVNLSSGDQSCLPCWMLHGYPQAALAAGVWHVSGQGQVALITHLAAVLLAVQDCMALHLQCCHCILATPSTGCYYCCLTS